MDSYFGISDTVSKHFVDIPKTRDGTACEKCRNPNDYYRRYQQMVESWERGLKVEKCFRYEGVNFLCNRCEYNMEPSSLMRTELEMKIIKDFSGSFCFFRDFVNQHGDPYSERSDKSDKTTSSGSSALGNENCELANKEAKKE